MELNSLPDDCILLLLELFPVNVQAQLRAVCTRWKLLIERVWLKVNKIDIKYDYPEGFCVAFDNHEMTFKVDSGLKPLVTKGHFPGVTSLSFDYSDNFKFSSDYEALLSHCLAQWTVTLTDLILTPSSLTSQYFQSSVWTQIDSMKSLKSLELHFPYISSVSITWKVPDNLSILSKLEKFELEDCWNKEVGALAQLGPNLRYLKFKKENYSENIFVSILPKLTSLSELSIQLFAILPQPLEHFTSLAQLSQLRKLDLGSFEWKQFSSMNTHNLEFPKLSTVKHLSMRVDFVITRHRHKIERTSEDCFKLLNDFNRHFFATIPIMFQALETIEVRFDFRDLYDQGFVDMFNDKLKSKFVKLREGKFTLGRGTD